MMFQVAWTAKQFPHCLNCVPKNRNSDIHLYDHIVDSLSSCHDDLHSEIALNFFNIPDFVIHQVNTLVSYSIRQWSKNIMISTACLSTHWTAHIKNVLLPTSYFLVPCGMILHVSSDSKSSESKRSIRMEFLHAFIPTCMVCMSQTFQKWVSTKIHQHGASSCIYTNMTQVAVPQVSGTIIITLYLLAPILWTCVTLRSRFNKPLKVIIQENRVSIILFKWIIVLQ